MECNRDEALRSKVLAEAKFSQRDYLGARKFAHKAKQLYPELEGIDQFLYVLDMHIVAQNKLQTGENNWYAILESEPFADENAIRKQYRRLALLLHPDKNKAVGAEAAFKHICEAWTVLSNKNKKAAYDARCQGKMPPPGGRPPQQNSAPNVGSKPVPNATAACVSPSQRQAQAEQPQPTPMRPQPATTPLPPKPRPSPIFTPPMPNSVSFWTSCPSCRMLLEFQRIFLLKNLCCPVCYKPFIASEVGAVSGTLLWPLPPKQHGYRAGMFSNGFHPSSGSNAGFPVPRFGSFPFGNVKVGHVTPLSNIPQQEKQEKAERKLTPELQQRVEERIMDVQARLNRHFMSTDGQDSVEGKQKARKRSTKEELKAKAAADAKEVSNSLMARARGVIEQKLSAEKERKLKEECANMKASTSQSDNDTRGLVGGSQAEQVFADAEGKGVTCREPLAESAKSPKGKSAGTTLAKDKDDDLPPTKKVKKSMLNGDEDSALRQESSEPPQDLDAKTFTQECTRTSPPLHESSESLKQAAAMDSNIVSRANDATTVADTEFYDFGKDRSVGQFLPGQVWAAYDDDDGMPRYYARVNKIVSSQPFKIQISWLEARSASDETLAWLDSGFSLTCGEFRVGKSITTDSIYMYSHLMSFEKGQRGSFKIYPKRGDIWALYKDWKNMMVKDGKAGYSVVEVLVDFEEEEGVQVCGLAKLDGYKTLFQRQIGEEHLEWICTSELRRFSHQIPAYRLASDLVSGMKEGCWELDRASTPSDLLS